MTGSDTDQQFLEPIRTIASGPAAEHADEVDRDARFPHEAITALKEARALGAMVDPRHGGRGVSTRAIAEACFELGRGCASTGMIFAMHQIKLATVVRHLDRDPWFEGYAARVADEQRLIGSITSEIGTGGDMGRSIAAPIPVGDGMFSLEKRAPTVSYGLEADDLLTTARRNTDAEESDQVMILHEVSKTEFEPAGDWDTLGMRGTCSPGFVVRTVVPQQQIMATPFATIMAESLVPFAHILWSHVWLGVATAAFDKAHAFVRASGRRNVGEPVPQAQLLARLLADLQMFRSETSSAVRDLEELDTAGDRAQFATLATMMRFNNLKLGASEQAVKVCMSALETIGIAGYRNNSPFAVGRHLRDALSAPLMIANERVAATDARWLLIAKSA